LYIRRNVLLVGTIGYLLCIIIHKFCEIITGISLPPQCEIGEGLHISHFGGIIVNSRSKIGDYCNLHQGVTIGSSGRGDNENSPILGDRVYIGANAVLIGDITIGDDVVIGAGAIVVNSIPARAVVVGNPAKIVSYIGSFQYVRYRGMDTDANRLKSLAANSSQEQV